MNEDKILEATASQSPVSDQDHADVVRAFLHRAAIGYNGGPAAFASLAALTAALYEARTSEAKIRQQHTVVMDAIKSGAGLRIGETEWRDDEWRAWEMYLGRMVECPRCAFTFGADHFNDTPDGGYSCPNCATEDLDTAASPPPASVASVSDSGSPS